MQPHQQRVIDEQAELETRLGKLTAFLQTDQYSDLDIEDQSLLFRQAVIMKRYLNVLKGQIARFE